MEFAFCDDGGAAVGNGAVAGAGFAGGKSAKCEDNSPIDAVQLGTGTNGTPKTLQAYNYGLMNADGTIPIERVADDSISTAKLAADVKAALAAKADKQTLAGGFVAGEGASTGIGGTGAAIGKSAFATMYGVALGENSSATHGGAAVGNRRNGKHRIFRGQLRKIKRRCHTARYRALISTKKHYRYTITNY